MVQREPVDSPLVVDSLAAADKCQVGILPAADRTHLVDTPLEAVHRCQVGILLAVVLDRPAGSHLVGDNYLADTHPAAVADHLVGNLLAVDSHLADTHHHIVPAGWGLVPGQGSNS